VPDAAATSSTSATSIPFPNGLSVTFNGWGRVLGVIGVPGVISLYLVWWLTERAGTKLDRIIQLLEQIARALRVSGA
jgi:hypothetical protein